MGGDPKLTTALMECKKYKDDIITSIIDSLSSHNFEAETTNESKTEIYVKTDNLSKANDIIKDEVDSVPDDVKNILIDTYRTKEGIYIRLKFK